MILTATNPEATGPMSWHLVVSAVVFTVVVVPCAVVVLGVIFGAVTRRTRRRSTSSPVRVDQSNVRLLPNSTPRRIDTSRRPGIPRRLEGPR